MEDLATARISVAQIAQRVVHSSLGEDTERVHDLGLLKGMAEDEGEDIIRMLGTGASQAQVRRYQNSVKIALALDKELHGVRLPQSRFVLEA